MWLSQKHLAGYMQQDAHEFFISVLDEMHKNNKGSDNDCECIIHKTFGGILQSDVTCLDCRGISTAFDPILDISIDINSAIRNIENGGIHTLYECLDGYTSAENRIQYSCKKCGSSQVFQLIFHFLREQVSNWHLERSRLLLASNLRWFPFDFQRFEHNLAQSLANKVDIPVKIPHELNMTNYTSKWLGNDVKFDPLVDTVPLYKYSLFALVQHVGGIDSGHYRAYCKQNHQVHLYYNKLVVCV
jgi:ubiquitin carboxyl-terminal hydrolase 22/27/51